MKLYDVYCTRRYSVISKQNKFPYSENHVNSDIARSRNKFWETNLTKNGRLKDT